MNKMLVAVFDAEPPAYEGLSALKDLHKAGDITLYATAVIVKDAAGTVRVKQEADEGPVGTALGALTGAAVGLLGGPVGAALGASIGGLTGALVDLGDAGIDVGFLDEVSKAMTPGKVAVLAEVQETWETPVDTRFAKLGGLVFRRLRSEVIEDQMAREAAAFKAERLQLREELAQSRAETRAAVQAQITAVDKKLEVIQAQAKARAEQAKRELDAKVEELQEQRKQANDRQKARIEKRIADAKADYAIRKAKLDQAGKLVKEALAT
jgi:uncharacterized membrane protein